MPEGYCETLQTYIDKCAAAGACEVQNHHLQPSQVLAQTSLSRDDATTMRTSMIYPNIITSLPPEPAPLPDLGRLKIRDHDDDRRPRKRSRSRRRSRSRSRRRHRDDDYYHRSARSTPMHSPRKDERFFDESPPPRSRRGVVSDRPKSHVRDVLPIALGESAKDTARRLYSDHHHHRSSRHHREESSSTASISGSRAGSRTTSRANSPAGLRKADPVERLKPLRRPGLDRGYSANDVRRADLAMASNVAQAGTDLLAPVYESPRHKRWHSKG